MDICCLRFLESQALSFRFGCLCLFVLVIYVFWFFRDPSGFLRGSRCVVAAADARLRTSSRVKAEVVQRARKRVGIFFVRHRRTTNRAPVDGKLIYRKSQPACASMRAMPIALPKNRA